MINDEFYEAEHTKGYLPHIRIHENEDDIGNAMTIVITLKISMMKKTTGKDAIDDDSEGGNDDNHGSQSFPHAWPNDRMFWSTSVHLRFESDIQLLEFKNVWFLLLLLLLRNQKYRCYGVNSCYSVIQFPYIS